MKPVSMMAMCLYLIGAVGLGLPVAAATPTPACAAEGDLGFVCGVNKPEDIVHIPGTSWLVASGFSDGEGLKLVDSQAKTLKLWYTGAAGQQAPDPKLACGPAPQPQTFKTRGLSLRRIADATFRLLVVSHQVASGAGRESIEIFEINTTRAEPELTWKGCLMMPEGQVANSVASFSDGTVLVTVLTRPGTSITDFVEGRVTGGVWQRRPTDTAFHLLPGTELPGNNGLETSADDRFFYVVAFGRHSVVVYDRADTSQPVREVVAPDFMPDNLRRSDGRLLAAGMRLDEPACGGRRKIIAGKADGMLCHRGFVVADFDPDAGTFSTVYYAKPTPAFSGVSSALIVDDILWLGSFQSDRLAWVPLEVR